MSRIVGLKCCQSIFQRKRRPQRQRTSLRRRKPDQSGHSHGRRSNNTHLGIRAKSFHVERKDLDGARSWRYTYTKEKKSTTTLAVTYQSSTPCSCATDPAAQHGRSTMHQSEATSSLPGRQRDSMARQALCHRLVCEQCLLARAPPVPRCARGIGPRCGLGLASRHHAATINSQAGKECLGHLGQEAAKVAKQVHIHGRQIDEMSAERWCRRPLHTCKEDRCLIGCAATIHPNMCSPP